MDLVDKNSQQTTPSRSRPDYHSEKTNVGRACENYDCGMRGVEANKNDCVMKKDWCTTHEVLCRKMTRTGKDWKCCWIIGS